METTDEVANDIRRLGLIADPFDASGDGSMDPLGVKLSKRNASHALHAAMYRSMRDSDGRPIIAERSSDIPDSYPVAALANVFGGLSNGLLGDVLQVYVPLDMMRIGRVRAVLQVLAERIAGASADKTIAAWATQVLAKPDAELPEWIALAETADIDALRARIEADPLGFVAEVFGPPVESRDGAEDLEVLMRVSHARQDRLDSDPADDSADDSADEVDSDDPMGEAFVTPLGVVDDHVLEAAPEQDADAIAEYLIAEARKLSPVLARGLAAYRAQGTNSMAEELKVSKAPSKTLVALMTFARARYEAAFVVFDRFDLFEIAPDDLKTDISTALFQMRWALKDLATIVLLLQPGIAPQVEEPFGTAVRVSWRFDELGAFFDRETPFVADVALGWLKSAAIVDTPDWAAELVASVPAGVTAEVGLAALETAIASALADGRDPRPDDVRNALQAVAG